MDDDMPFPISKRFHFVLALVVGGLVCSGTTSRAFIAPTGGPQMVAHPAGVSKAHLPGTGGYGKLPLSFEANRGQTDPRVDFLARGRGYTLFLTGREAVLALRASSPRSSDRHESPQPGRGAVVRMTLVGARSPGHVAGRDERPGKANYFLGNDPRKWHANVPTYAKVNYQDAYPGIDLSYYGRQGQLEYDFIVRPGADPGTITLDFNGADTLEVDEHGDLVLHTPIGGIRQRKPSIYQEFNGVRKEIAGAYVIRNKREVGFEVAAYDGTRPLVIDPVLSYSTYLGGAGYEEADGIAVDVAGNAYVTGYTVSTDFPTTAGALHPTFNGGSSDAFVTKLNPTGSGLVYSTYLGGNGNDAGHAIAVDATGNAYVTGETDSANLLTTSGAFQNTFGGGLLDVFVTKLNSTGSALVYSTYVGASGTENGLGIAVDTTGNAYLTGFTSSTTFPTTLGAFQTTFAGGCGIFLGGPEDAFVTKLNVTGSGLVYSTYLGGSCDDAGVSVALDAAGNAFVTGQTSSPNFPTTPGAFQTAFGGGSFDAFVTKLNPTGTGLFYSAFLGGVGTDYGFHIALDPGDNAFVAGATNSTDFPTTLGAFQTTFGGGAGFGDAFVTKLTLLGNGLVYSTYLGDSGDDAGIGIAVDVSGNAYVTGETNSTTFPTVNAVQSAPGGGGDAFVTKLDSTGAGLVYSTFLGGSGRDDGFGIALDSLPNPSAYVTGRTISTNFPTTSGAFQVTFGGGGNDAFVARIAEVSLDAPITATGTTFGATEGVTFTGTVATFSDPDPASTAAEYAATIDWGDTTPTTPGTISGPTGGPFTVSGTHMYAEEGTYAVTVVITDIDSPSNTATAHSTARVGDANLSSMCATPPVSTQTYTGPTAIFTDQSSTGTLSDFSATISWGDSSTSPGTIAGGPGNAPYTVTGTHTYASTGTFLITTTINDVGGSTTTTPACSVIVFAFATGNGAAFVIGDLEAGLGNHVTWWSSQWARINLMSGGAPPNAMKGFAGFEDNFLGLPPPNCGGTWSTDPGNSTPPPPSVPNVMGVIVSSHVTKSGSIITGDIKQVVIVRNDPGYAPDPGHPGTGTEIAIVCMTP